MGIFPPQDETHPVSHSNTLEARLASALETMSLCEIAHLFFFHRLREPCQE